MSGAIVRRPARSARSVAVAVVTTVVAGQILDRWSPGGPGWWDRTNHAGDPVTLLEGPQVVVGSAIAAVATGAPVAALSALMAGGFGALDDLAGDSSSKGLGGHLGALSRGRVTTGVVKVIGLGVTGLVVGLTSPGRTPHPPGHRREDASGTLQVLLDAGVVAGSANLVNLLDLRPGRALKATILLGAPLAARGSPAAAAVVGSALAALPRDLAARAMLGDTGANALGAVLGTAAVCGLPPRGRWAVLTGLVVLTLVSERVSFTAVIDRTPVLREIDSWGRQPPALSPDSRRPR